MPKKFIHRLFLGHYVTQEFSNLTSCFAPSISCLINFFQGMNEFFGMQCDIRNSSGRTIAGIKSSIPLFVLVAKAHDDQVGRFNVVSGTNGVYTR